MSSVRRFLLRCYAWLRPGPADRRLAREIDAHLALMEEDLVRQGMAPDEAHRAARRVLGGVEPVKEAQRQARSIGWLDDGWRDLGYAVRSLRRTPGFAVAAIVTLALGIGGVTLIYSVVHHVLLRPLPYRDAERMVTLAVEFDDGGRTPRFGPEEFLDYAQQADVFEGVVGVVVTSRFLLSERGAERLRVALATPELFSYLGAAPLLGRVFGPADADPAAPAVAVLGYRPWTTLFGQDPDVVGTAIRLNDEPRTIVGVMPPRFAWAGADVWLPIALTSPAGRGHQFAFHARLRPDVSLEAAEAQLTAIAGSRYAASPNPRGRTVSRGRIRPVIDLLVGNLRGVLYTLLAAVGLLLAIACCNVANMLLARATAREREVAVRAALGASRARIVRQLLVENAVLACGGAVGGCVLASLGIGIVRGWLPRLDVPAEAQLRLDLPVLSFALALTILATLVFGLFPAVQGARRDLAEGTRQASLSSTATRRQRRLRSGLVIAEVALSLILVVGAGLLLRSFLRAIDFDLGFDHRDIVVADIVFPPGLGPEPRARATFYRAVMDGVRRLQGVEAVAISSALPPWGGGRTSVLGLDGWSSEPPSAGVIFLDGWKRSDPPTAGLIFTSEGIVDTLDISLVAGRLLSVSDVDQARHVMLVNETLAERYFKDRSPIGRTIRIGRLGESPPRVGIVDGRVALIGGSSDPGVAPEFEVVGVVGDVANAGAREAVEPGAYVPYTVATESVSNRLFIRFSAGTSPRAAALRTQIAAVSPVAALTRFEPLQDHALMWPVSDEQRFSLTVLGTFALTGLGLIGLGVYGVIAYTVGQQTREFAIRLALGGERRHIMGQVLRTTAWLVGAGVVIGLGAGLALARVLASQIEDVSPRDPFTLASAVAIVLFIGMLGCVVPARRATHVDPNVALRHE